MGKLATIGTALAVLLIALLVWWSSTPEREPRSVETAREGAGTEPPPAEQGGSESESPESEEDAQPLARENAEASAAGRSRLPQARRILVWRPDEWRPPPGTSQESDRPSWHSTRLPEP